MVFSSLLFLYFFLPLSIIFYFVFKDIRVKNIILLVFSFVFYAWGEPLWVVLLAFSGVVDYLNGLFIQKMRDTKYAVLGVVNSVVINLLLLATFKYADFITENVNFVFGTSLEKPGILLPVGISFYTFQTISYTIDVYRKQIEAQRNFVSFMMYVSLFPQLVAGPIVRYTEIVAEINKRSVSWDIIWEGINRFSLGLFKKVVLANTSGILVEKYLETQFLDLSSTEAWFGITMFSIQLYFDFSGYSDMAIGLGKIFGFNYNENFKHPYAARSVADFYRRWHMSLGRFLRDYVYIPLGGNRKYQLRNIMIVWLLTGLWHGASWNFVLWGAFFGVFMIVEKVLEKFFAKVPLFLRHVYTLILIVFSRAIFYYVDFGKLKDFVANLFVTKNPIGEGFIDDLTSFSLLYVVVILFCIPWDEIYTTGHRFHSLATSFYKKFALLINILFLVLATILIVDDTYNPFIYFRF